MGRISVELPEERLQELRELAAKLGVAPEELLRASVEGLLAQPDEVLKHEVDYLLKKHDELLRRLA